ncbi:hypothetical protein [Halobacillus salinus]|uniref:General stress protein 17M-like domain-containing protein n=1 Tax=Halobacillus salinus TaxID=192814 RepID=A0A4Z0H3H9_9BACI|nr:hypothetical protein [Halobacillus salinus]TGB03991.1 hypothetical protein E4663_03010 [Halobacillus salinus]
MTKHIEAFFETENDAESAKADLQELGIEKELVEPIPEEADVLPIVPVAGSTNVGGAGISYDNIVHPGQDDTGKKHLTHVLHFYLSDEHFDRAIEKIGKHSGHMNEKHL